MEESVPEAMGAHEPGSRLDELLHEATRLWRSRDNPTRLLDVCLELIELDPDLGPPLVYAGWCYEQDGHGSLGLAFEMYQRALGGDLRGDRREFAESRVRYLASRVRRERLEEEIATAIATVRTSRDATALARSLRADERLKWAHKAHERAVDLAESEDDLTRALTSWAATCRDSRDSEEALRLADQALELARNPRTNGPTYAVRIAALCDLGEHEHAVTWGELALKTVPRDPFLLRAMGRAYRLMLADGFKPSIADRAEQCFIDALRFGGGRAPLPELERLLDLYRREGRIDRVARLEAATGLSRR